MARKFVLGKGYTHFAVEATTNKIINGWDYKGYDQEDLNSDKNHYFMNDVKDIIEGIISLKDIRIIKRNTVINRGIVIESSDSWYKFA